MYRNKVQLKLGFIKQKVCRIMYSMSGVGHDSELLDSTKIFSERDISHSFLAFLELYSTVNFIHSSIIIIVLLVCFSEQNSLEYKRDHFLHVARKQLRLNASVHISFLNQNTQPNDRIGLELDYCMCSFLSRIEVKSSSQKLKGWVKRNRETLKRNSASEQKKEEWREEAITVSSGSLAFHTCLGSTL